MFLEHHTYSITPANLQGFIDLAISQIQPHHVQGFAVDAHYFVPGRRYRPYVY